MRPTDTDWTPDFAGERYHARWLLGCRLSAGCNHIDWRGPRAPWSLSIDCHRAEAEALVRELGMGETKAHGSLDETWTYSARGLGDDQADAQQLAEGLAGRVVRLLEQLRATAATAA